MMTMSQVIEIDAQYVAQKLKSWAEKSGKQPEELKTEFQSLYAKTEGRTEAIRMKKTLNQMKRGFETSMNSNAIMYKVVILGTSTFDAVKKRRRQIMERYEKAPAESITKGEIMLIDGVPTPMDIQKTFPNSGKENPFYGKPIPEHAWTINCVAVAMKPTEDQKWLPASVVLRGDEFVTGDIPIGREMNIRLNGTFSSEQGKYVLNSSKGATNFSNLGEKLSPETLSNILDTVYGDKFVLADNLEENLENTKTDGGRIVVTEGILNSHYKAESGKMSTIVLSDESLDIGKTIKGFVDESIVHQLDNLENGDEVSVICRTSWGKGYENGQKTDEDVLNMNVYGIIPKPE